MKITFICMGSHYAGLEINTLNLIDGLRAKGHQVRVIVSKWNDGELIQRLDERQLDYELIAFGKIGGLKKVVQLGWLKDTLINYFDAHKQLNSHLAHHKPDVTVVFNRDVAFLASRALRRVPSIFHCDELSTTSFKVRMVYRSISKAVTSCIAVSRSVKSELGLLGFSQDKIDVIYNGVETDQSSSAGGERDTVQIGICGQVGEWKGHEDLVLALAKLDGLGLNFRCLIFGRGTEEYTVEMEQLIEKHSLQSRVVWKGFVENPGEIYPQIDILAAPSRCVEAFGLVAAEAGAHGIPVVCSDRGGLPEIVADGETGFVVPAFDPDRLASALSVLVNDPGLRDQMGRAAKARVSENFSAERMIVEHERHFAETAELWSKRRAGT